MRSYHLLRYAHRWYSHQKRQSIFGFFDSRPGTQESIAPCTHIYTRGSSNSSKRFFLVNAENVPIHVFFVKIEVPILRASNASLRACQKTRSLVPEKTCFRASHTRLRGPKVLFSTPSQNGNASVFLVFEEKAKRK